MGMAVSMREVLHHRLPDLGEQSEAAPPHVYRLYAELVPVLQEPDEPRVKRYGVEVVSCTGLVINPFDPKLKGVTVRLQRQRHLDLLDLYPDSDDDTGLRYKLDQTTAQHVTLRKVHASFQMVSGFFVPVLANDDGS
jgi:hypothetical protein